MPISKFFYTFDVLTNHLILTKMKKLKLIFGVLMVSAFIGATILTYTSNNHQALLKKDIRIIPRQG